MASQAQVRYAKALLSKGGVVLDIDEGTPTKAASWLIDQLKAGNEPSDLEWQDIIKQFSDVDSGARGGPENKGGAYGPWVFNNVLDSIKDPCIRTFTSAMIKQLPDYFYHVAASSTGKYHPQLSLGEGGLVRHTLTAIKFLDELAGDAALISDLTESFGGGTHKGLEMAKAALIIHDGWKHGRGAEATDHTTFTHPIIPRKVYNEELKGQLGFGEDDEVVVEQILSAVDSHMGPWCTSKYEDTRLPVPETPLQKLVHECDYLSSRRWLGISESDMNMGRQRGQGLNEHGF